MMKPLMKKTMFTLLAVSMLASAMTGCGKNEPETAEATPETTVATEAATEPATEKETAAETEAQTEEPDTTEETTLSAEAETEAETDNADEPDYNTMFYDLIRTVQTSFQNSDATTYNDNTTERLWAIMKEPMYRNVFNEDVTTPEGQDDSMVSAMAAMKNADYRSTRESNTKWQLYDDVTIQGIVFQEQLDKDWYTALHHMIDEMIANEGPDHMAYSTSDAFFEDYPFEDMAVVDHVQDRIYLVKVNGEWLVDVSFYPLVEKKGTDGITKFDAYLKDENGVAIGY